MCEDIKSTLVSRNITVLGKRTSVRLEPEMWNSLKEISRREKCKIHDICSLIQLRKNKNTSLTAAIRVFLLLYYRASSTEEGHFKAGHGNFEGMVRRARVPESFLEIVRSGKSIVDSKMVDTNIFLESASYNQAIPDVKRSYAQ